MFNFGSRAARKSPVATSETAMSAEVTTAAAAPPASGHNSGAHTDTRELVELLEADLKRAGKRMEETGGVTKRRVGEAVTIVDDLRCDTDRLAEETAAAHSNINALADGCQELHHTAEEIGRRAQTSQKLVDDAGEVAKVASRSIDDLKAAIGQIQAVVSLISDVAGQTNLLAQIGRAHV